MDIHDIFNMIKLLNRMKIRPAHRAGWAGPGLESLHSGLSRRTCVWAEESRCRPLPALWRFCCDPASSLQAQKQIRKRLPHHLPHLKYKHRRCLDTRRWKETLSYNSSSFSESKMKDRFGYFCTEIGIKRWKMGGKGAILTRGQKRKMCYSQIPVKDDRYHRRLWKRALKRSIWSGI